MRKVTWLSGLGVMYIGLIAGACSDDAETTTAAAASSTTGGGLVCAEGRINCGECIDPLTDDDFCGASGDCKGDNLGEQCLGGASCEDGECVGGGEGGGGEGGMGPTGICIEACECCTDEGFGCDDPDPCVGGTAQLDCSRTLGAIQSLGFCGGTAVPGVGGAGGGGGEGGAPPGEICGDGEINGNPFIVERERCDDGNLVSGDGCSGTPGGAGDPPPCQPEPGWVCTGGETSPSVCTINGCNINKATSENNLTNAGGVNAIEHTLPNPVAVAGTPECILVDVGDRIVVTGNSQLGQPLYVSGYVGEGGIKLYQSKGPIQPNCAHAATIGGVTSDGTQACVTANTTTSCCWHNDGDDNYCGFGPNVTGCYSGGKWHFTTPGVYPFYNNTTSTAFGAVFVQ